MYYIEEGQEESLKDVDSDLQLPRPRLFSLDSDRDFLQKRQTDEILIDKLLHILQEIDEKIQRKIEALETIYITIQIVTFKIYEATHDFKSKIGQVKEERTLLLTSIENKSELSLILNDLDKKISELEKELDEKVKKFNKEKIELQHQAEAIIFQLDEDLTDMQDRMKELNEEFQVQTRTMYRAQIMLLNQKYNPLIEPIQGNLLKYEKLQENAWKVEHAEARLSEILEEQGLKFTPSGKLLTRAGSHVTFEEAQEKGYFKDISFSLDRIFQLFKEQDKHQQYIDQIGPPDASTYSEGSSVDSRMSTEDVKYLKQYLGKPLTLALAEITAKQPKDPIHYLGHYLFKYHYNQEIEEIEKKEIEELTAERKRLAQERWKKFVEEEARNAVIEMILRAEKIAYENELKRIEQEQLLMAELEEEMDEGGAAALTNELIEEAKDKFE